MIGNITRLKVLDMSDNKLEDLSSEPDLFKIPENTSEIYLSHNSLHDLPWKSLKSATQLAVLDVSHNNFNTFGRELTEMVAKNVSVVFEGKLHYL